MKETKSMWQMTQEERIADAVSGLRKLADWLEKNGAAIEEIYPTFTCSAWTADKTRFKEIVGLMRGSKLEKRFSETYVETKKAFSRFVSFDVCITRQNVCERIVVGTREVPEVHVPARTEEIVEWKCNDKSFVKK